MPESQEEIDALLAEVNALAEEAVADIVGDQAEALDPVGAPARATASAASGSRPAEASFEGGARQGRTGPSKPGDINRILGLQVPVIVELATRTMPLVDILNLSTGAIIEFEKPADGDLDLMINNKCIGRGQAVKAGENFGLRVTVVGTVRDRIQAMAR